VGGLVCVFERFGKVVFRRNPRDRCRLAVRSQRRLIPAIVREAR